MQNAMNRSHQKTQSTAGLICILRHQSEVEERLCSRSVTVAISQRDIRLNITIHRGASRLPLDPIHVRILRHIALDLTSVSTLCNFTFCNIWPGVNQAPPHCHSSKYGPKGYYNGSTTKLIGF